MNPRPPRGAYVTAPLILAALLSLAPACPPNPTPPPAPDAAAPDAGADASVDATQTPEAAPPKDAAPEASAWDAGPNDACAQACAVLHAHPECPDGANIALCTVTCRKADGQITALRPACVAKATTVAAIRACSPSVCR